MSHAQDLPPTTADLISLIDVPALLKTERGVSIRYRTLWGRAQQGDFETIRLGRLIFVRRQDLDAIVAAVPPARASAGR